MEHVDIVSSFRAKFKVDNLLLYQNFTFTLSLRPGQLTLGAMIVSVRLPFESFSSIFKEDLSAMKDFIDVVSVAEDLAFNFFKADKINFYTLMMVDSIYHVHVTPRYQNKLLDSEFDIYFDGQGFDIFWPNPVNFCDSNELSDELLNSLCSRIRNFLKLSYK